MEEIGGQMSNIPQVRLHNGETVPQPVVITTMLCINKMLEGVPTTLALIDLVEHCRNNSPLPSSSFQLCTDFALILETGKVHDIVRAIILSSAQGSGLSLQFTNPIAVD